MHTANELEVPFGSDYRTRGYAPVVGEKALAQSGKGTAAARARQETANASYHGGVDLEARLALIEARQAYADVSLACMEACRRHIELRLEDAFDCVAHAAGDVGQALLRR